MCYLARVKKYELGPDNQEANSETTTERYPHYLTPRFFLLALIWAAALVNVPSAEAISFRHCNNEAKANIWQGVQFMKENMKTLKRDFKFSTVLPRKDNRIRRRMSRKLGKIKFICASGPGCRKWFDGFHALGIASRRIRICYDKLRDRYKGTNRGFCQLTEIVAHEYGHAIGLPKKFGRHSLGGSPPSDAVYRFGWFVGNLCESAGLDRNLTNIPGRR